MESLFEQVEEEGDKDKKMEKNKKSELDSSTKQMIKDVKGLKERVDELEMAVELFKTYGFQPKQFDQLMNEMRSQKGIAAKVTPFTSNKESEFKIINKYGILIASVLINLAMIIFAFLIMRPL